MSTTLYVFTSEHTSTAWYLFSRYLPSEVEARVANHVPEPKVEFMVDVSPESRRAFKVLVRHESIQKLLGLISRSNAKYVHISKNSLCFLKYLALNIPYDLYSESFVKSVESRYTLTGLAAYTAPLRNALYDEITTDDNEFPMSYDDFGFRKEDISPDVLRLVCQERYLKALLNNLTTMTRKDVANEYLGVVGREERDLVDALLS